MNKNIKIAKELVRLAKDLVAEGNSVDKQGKYENFTGNIRWKNIGGNVENATFELVEDKNKPIIWHKGVWKDGNWENGTWEDGTWKNGTWKKGIWRDGTWENGTWENGTWHDGFDKDDNEHFDGESPDKW